MKKPDIFYITTPIYYVNDKPHIGHVYSTLAADVVARWHRQSGDNVFFLTGTDEHGAKVAESAAKANTTPQEFADENSALFRQAFSELAISNDQFIRTTDDAHIRQVGVFLTKLKERGAIYEGEYRGLYCTGCENFLTEKELVDGLCPIHKRPPELITEKNYFFRLTDYLDEVEKRIRSGEIRIEPESRRQEALGLLAQGLEDFSISREKVSWGIPFPFDPSQTVYVWVEALQNYITGIGYADDRKRFERYWPHVTHVIGKDILKFHTIYWPALLLAAGEAPPRRLFIHGYFTVDGDKMSKSLGNVIASHDLVARYGADATRYILLSQFPFGDDGDIRVERFAEKYTADLANGIGNFASRVLAMVHRFAGGEVPVATAVSSDVETKIRATHSTVREALETFAFERALAAIQTLISDADARIDRSKPWQLTTSAPGQLPQILFDLLAVLANVTVLLAPFLPDTTTKLATALGLGNLTAAEPVLPPGRSLAPIQPLFPRLAAP